MRNAGSEALTSQYGPGWPWSAAFERSLRSAASQWGHGPRKNLITIRKAEPTTGKVIAELKFVFWQKMFTARHDKRLWKPSILGLFPNATAALFSRAHS